MWGIPGQQKLGLGLGSQLTFAQSKRPLSDSHHSLKDLDQELFVNNYWAESVVITVADKLLGISDVLEHVLATSTYIAFTTTTMHSIYARINNVSAFASSCLMALLGAIALSSFIFNMDPKGDLLVSSVKVLVPLPHRQAPYSRSQMGEFRCWSTPFIFPRFVGHDRRFHHRSQEYALVNFNISAGVYWCFHTAIQRWRLCSPATRSYAAFQLEYQAALFVPRSRVWKHPRSKSKGHVLRISPMRTLLTAYGFHFAFSAI